MTGDLFVSNCEWGDLWTIGLTDDWTWEILWRFKDNKVDGNGWASSLSWQVGPHFKYSEDSQTVIGLSVSVESFFFFSCLTLNLEVNNLFGCGRVTRFERKRKLKILSYYLMVVESTCFAKALNCILERYMLDTFI